MHINLPAAYNIYNAVGSAAALYAFGFTPEAIVHALGAFGCGFGRMEKFDLRGTPGRMMLVKNPAGCNQTMRYLAGLNEDATFVVCSTTGTPTVRTSRGSGTRTLSGSPPWASIFATCSCPARAPTSCACA